MLDINKIEENKNKLISIIRANITRGGCDIEGLINKLENSDYFTAPCTVKYFGSYDGGLCEYSLKTYEAITNLISAFNLSDQISLESATIVSLFYNFYKMNFYIKDNKNVKINGTWTQQPYYKVKDIEDRFIYGTNGETAEFMIRYYIPLSVDESRAIINATRDTEDGSNYIPAVYHMSKLAVILNSAINMANYI